MFSLCQFSCLDVILSLTYKQRPPPKQFLSHRNILYPFIYSWLLGKELQIFISEIRKISNVSSIIFFIVSNLFLRKLMFKWPRIKFFGLFRRKCLSSVKQLFMSSEEFWVKILSFDILLCLSSKLVFSIIRVHEGPLHIPIDILLSQYNLKHSLSAVYHRSCLSVDLLHWYNNGDLCGKGRSNQSYFLRIFLSRKCLLYLLLHLIFFFGTRLGKLNNFVCYFIGIFVGDQIVCPNIKNYLSRWFFLSRFHVVCPIVYFSTRKCFTTACFLNFVVFEMVFPYTFCSIESPKTTVVGAFVLTFLFDIVFSLSLLES